MIRNTHENNSKGILSAYKDNAAVFEGFQAGRFSLILLLASSPIMRRMFTFFVRLKPTTILPL